METTDNAMKLARKIDPLDILNEFTSWEVGIEGEACPIMSGPWLKKLAALCERLADCANRAELAEIQLENAKSIIRSHTPKPATEEQELNRLAREIVDALVARDDAHAQGKAAPRWNYREAMGRYRAAARVPEPVATATSRTYGELPEQLAEFILPHEWDNKTPSEQRDWLIELLSWKPNLPPERKLEPIATAGVELPSDEEVEAFIKRYPERYLGAAVSAIRSCINWVRDRPATPASVTNLPSDEEVRKYFYANYLSRSPQIAIKEFVRWLRARQSPPAQAKPQLPPAVTTDSSVPPGETSTLCPGEDQRECGPDASGVVEKIWSLVQDWRDQDGPSAHDTVNEIYHVLRAAPASVTTERDRLVDGIKHAISELLERPEDDEFAQRLRQHLMGTITDDNGRAMMTQEELAESAKETATPTPSRDVGATGEVRLYRGTIGCCSWAICNERVYYFDGATWDASIMKRCTPKDEDVTFPREKRLDPADRDAFLAQHPLPPEFFNSPAQPTKHVCGLTGFGAQGDVCPACSPAQPPSPEPGAQSPEGAGGEEGKS